MIISIEPVPYLHPRPGAMGLSVGLPLLVAFPRNPALVFLDLFDGQLKGKCDRLRRGLSVGWPSRLGLVKARTQYILAQL